MIQPALYGILAPLLIALLIGVADSRRASLRPLPLAGLGVLVALLVGLVGLEGRPPFPPVAAKQKIFFAALGAGLAGAVLDVVRSPSAARIAIGWAAWLLGAVWIGWRTITSGSPAGVGLVALGLGALPVSFAALRLDARHGALASGPLLLAVALALAGVAGAGASITLAFFCSAVAAALGGVMLAAYVGSFTTGAPPRPFGAAGVLSAGGALSSAAAALLLFTPDASVAALSGVVLVPFLVLASFRLPMRSASEARLRPVVTVAAGLLVTLLVCAIALLQIDAPANP